MKRVVVTGLGVISPVGNTVEDFFKSLVNGVNGIDTITRFDVSDSRYKLAAEVKDFDPTLYIDKIAAKRLDRFVLYALSAAAQAMADSGIEGGIDPEDLSVYFGSGIGGFETFCDSHQTLLEKGAKKVSPLFIPKMIGNIAAGNIAIARKAMGDCISISTACATGTTAIGEGYRAIKDGYSKAVICGGAEASITPLSIAGFGACMALSPSEDKNAASLPFDKRRGGFVMGEGAGALILEEYEYAKARGAKIYAEVVGYGSTCDAYHITLPDPTAKASSKAIKDALKGIDLPEPGKIYLNAHGTGTSANDSTETKAIHNVFAKDASKISISSTKSMTGHMLGAAGAVEAIVGILAIKEGIVPPTINLEDQDFESCDLNYTPNLAKTTEIELALSTSFGFGGHNACVSFKKFKD